MDSDTLTAIAEPNRLRIIELLRDGGPRPVGEIGAYLRIRQPQVSKHLRVLHDAGIVTARPIAQQRVYQLEAAPFSQLESWLDSFHKVWETRLDTLDEYLRDLQNK